MGEKLPGMLLSLLIILKVFRPTEASCSLTQVTSSLTANCSSQGLTSVPQNLPTGVTHLNLQNNVITTLNQSDFSQYGNLTNLDLENNEIREIQTGTFYPTPELRTLSLSHNKLTSLRSDMFMGLGTLNYLYLDNNEISGIQAGTFNATSELGTLHLQYNKISVLKAEIFAKLSSISIVNISNNPWQCDCNMVPFRQKMNGSYLFENQITCEGPRGQKVKDISPENLMSDCEKPTMQSIDNQWNVHTAVNHGFIGFVSGNSHIFSLPVLVGSASAIFLLIVATIILRIWYKRHSKNVKKSSDPRVVFNNTDPTANVTVRAHDKTRHGALGAEEEYDYIDTPAQRPHRGTALCRFQDEYEVRPPSLPSRNMPGPSAADQNGSAAAHVADAPHGVMDEDDYVNDDSQSNKYENGHVIAAAQDTETAVHVIMHADDYLSFVVTEKYKDSQMTAAAPQGISHENDIESAENQTQAVCQNKPVAVHGAESYVQYWGEWYELS